MLLGKSQRFIPSCLLRLSVQKCNISHASLVSTDLICGIHFSIIKVLESFDPEGSEKYNNTDIEPKPDLVEIITYSIFSYINRKQYGYDVTRMSENVHCHFGRFEKCENFIWK